MSWFDATGFASIAKSALKEAQRTIDKALDIQEETYKGASNIVDSNHDEIFESWIDPQLKKNDEKTKEKSDDGQINLWGPFAGSLFENFKEYKRSISSEGLDDTVNTQHFSQSKLVVEENEDYMQQSNEICDKLIVENNTIGETRGDSEVLSYKDSYLSDKCVKDDEKCDRSEISNLSSIDLEEKTTLSIVENVLSENEDVDVTIDSLEKLTSEERYNLIPATSSHLSAITIPPCRNHQILHPDNILIDTQPQCSKQEIPDILKSTNVIDIPQDDDSLKSSLNNLLDVSIDEGSQSDRTIRGSDDFQNTSDEGGNLKTLLAEAIHSEDDSINNDGVSSENLSIVQIERPLRDNSPLSSDKSDLVKIGSDHTSGHTSGDELETATSSDIEIISSPNGDSSSTQSRQSSAKETSKKITKDGSNVDVIIGRRTIKNIRGHNRELSETSSVSDDMQSHEIEKMMKKITELTDILESRESKLIEMNRKNLELQELNMELKSHLNSTLSKQLESQDLTQVTEEYAQRMSALEKKFQRAIREKDILRKQLEQVQQESSTRISRSEFDKKVSDKEDMINQLREEGDKLSKQQLQHSIIIKKLRTKEKENELAMKQLKEKLDDMTSESERLARIVNAKEEVERTQIEALNQFSSKNKKLESDLAKALSELDDQSQKYETLKKSLDAAKKELSDKTKISNQLNAKDQLLENLKYEKKVAESQNEDVINQLQYLRFKLHEYERDYLEKERKLKLENNEILERLENAESRNEELSRSILEVSKPLMRQLENLQVTHNQKITYFEKIEIDLTAKINDLQFQLMSALNNEKISKEECINLRSILAKTEVDYNSMKNSKESIELKFDQYKTQGIIAEREMKTKLEELETRLNEKTQELELLNQKNVTLKTSLERALDEMDHKDLIKTSNMKKTDSIENVDDSNSNPRSSNSPTLSVGKGSMADSLASSVWSQLEPFEVGQAPRFTNMFEIQTLQTNLQQRDGELQQLQWELNRREQEKNLLNNELISLANKVDDLSNNLVEYENIKLKFEELQQQYDVLCQMYGEKVDEVEELRLDLLEAKEAYKSQLDELLTNNSLNS